MFLPLLVGLGLLIVSLLLYSVATTLIVGMLTGLIRRGYAEPRFWKNVAVMLFVTLVTTLAHVVQIALWAVALVLCGEVSNFTLAFYLSAENYTALGYGDIVLSERWRLLGPLKAINGLLLFGLSTAALFAVMGRLIAYRLRSQLKEPLSGNQDHA
jgi:hypothetical protein